METEQIVKWSPEIMVEVGLNRDDDFLKIKETLTRIGIASNKDNVLYQTAHILHKKGKYYIVHFKEMFLQDGRQSNLTVEDVERRNRIIKLLEEWNLLTIASDMSEQPIAEYNTFKIIPHKDKHKWNLKPKYSFGAV